MKKATLTFKNVNLTTWQLAKFRGYVGRLFEQYDLIHNHKKDGSTYYRYPKIQFKLIDEKPAITAITNEAIKIFIDIFNRMDTIQIDHITIPVFEKDITLEDSKIGFSESMLCYRFTSPWLGLNQKKHRMYLSAKTRAEKQKLLRSSLIGNTLSMSKELGIWLDRNQKLQADFNLKPYKVKLKGTPMTGFTGEFRMNYFFPDHLGIGKSSSRGFGTVHQIKTKKQV